MIGEYRRKTNIGIGFGILTQVAGYLLTFVSIGIVLWFAAILIYGGLLLFIWGLWNYAKGKGYAGLWGLLGLLSIFGLIILALFPDKNSQKK